MSDPAPEISDLINKTLKNFSQESFEELLTKLGGTNWTDENQRTLLHIAVQKRCNEAVKTLIEKDPNLINSTEKQLQSPLHYAALYGKPDTVSLLLNNKADVNALSRYARETPAISPSVSPVYLAAKYSTPDCVKLLLSAGANVNQQTNEKWTALHEAAAHNKFEVVKLLVEAGANASIKNEDDETALDLAKKKKADQQLIDYLTEKTPKA